MTLLSVELVNESNLDDSFTELVASSIPNGERKEAYRYLQDAKQAIEKNKDARMLWKLLYDDKVIGWSHCGYQFEYSSFLDDGVGLAVIEAEFNYIYINPEYRNQSFSHQFGWQIGVATANHIPFDLFNEEIKDIETSMPLTLVNCFLPKYTRQACSDNLCRRAA